MSDERQASERAQKMVANYELVACNLRSLGAGELADAEREVLDYIAALEADFARIQWMEEHPHGCAIRHPDKWIVPDYKKHAPNHRGYTLRGAIDAAMSSSQRAPASEGAT